MTDAAVPPRAAAWPFLPAFAALAAALAVHVLLSGPATGSDTQTYVLWADRLRASGFDYPGMLRVYGEPLGATYALFVGLVALLRMVFGEHWGSALLALNLFAVAAVGASLAQLAVRMSGDRAAGWAALGLSLLCHDLWQWTPYLLSDSVFLLFAFGVFMMEASRLLATGKAWLPVFIASAAASLFRPTGIVLFPVTVWAFLLAKLPDRAGARRLALLALILAGAAGAALFGWIVEEPARWPLSFGARAVDGISATYSNGLVVWQRPETYLAPAQDLSDHWAIMAARFAWFFSPGAAGYSAAHWAVQIAFFTPAYGLAGWFVFTLLSGRSHLQRGARDVGFAAVGAILLYAIFHAMMHVDYDWRYRIPVLPHLILLAACGFSDARLRLARRAGSHSPTISKA